MGYSLRSKLREGVLSREAASYQSVSKLLLAISRERSAKLGLPFDRNEVLDAILKTSSMHGVICVQLFDKDGNLLISLPEPEKPQAIPRAKLNQYSGGATAEFKARVTLETIFEPKSPISSSSPSIPLIELGLPIHKESGNEILGFAVYNIDGRQIAHEFELIDEALGRQATLAVGASFLFFSIGLALSLSRLNHANKHIAVQNRELDLAKRDLDFAAKTNAVGAISAHLIHDIKNPLAGLECYVTDRASTQGAEGESWQLALETTRRLRSAVEDAASMLKDEPRSFLGHKLTANEVLELVKKRTNFLADAAGVDITNDEVDDVHIDARNAGLTALVLTNLATNAIQASKRGTRVHLALKESRGALCFDVIDQGGGIPMEERNNLFSPIKSTKLGGGGIGLAISHRLAMHAGGNLGLLYTGATGTAFRLTLTSPI